MTSEELRMAAKAFVASGQQQEQLDQQEYDRLLELVEMAAMHQNNVQAAIFLLQFKHGDKSAQSKAAKRMAEDRAKANKYMKDMLNKNLYTPLPGQKGAL